MWRSYRLNAGIGSVQLHASGRGPARSARPSTWFDIAQIVWRAERCDAAYATLARASPIGVLVNAMNDEGPRTGRLLIAAVLFLAFAGGAWYITYLQTQNAQLRGQPPQDQSDSAAPAAAPAAPAAVAGGRSLSGAQRDAMIAKLRSTAAPERPVWFATYAGSSEAATFRLALQTIFEEAGWEVRGNAQVNFQLKPGLYLMAADEEPPQYVFDAGEALDAAGLKTTIGRGYRAFYEEKKKENPNWNGVGLSPEQSYVLVVGPQPP